jgi:branched-chain amino acid transport system ATP-binding protein
MNAPILQVEGLRKRFGAIAAVDDATLRFEAGRLHGIIGPNGAGKTTLINLMFGELRPDGGRILLKGTSIAGATPDRIARLGVGRSYQSSQPFPQLTCGESCRLAARGTDHNLWRWFGSAPGERQVRRCAREALAMTGLEQRADTLCGALSHGEQRRLELALLLATGADLLLLDEPLAGTDRADADRLIALLQGLKGRHTIVLIEHDLDAVFALADAVTVMVRGRVLETGPPAQIRDSQAVQDAYLGTAEERP